MNLLLIGLILAIIPVINFSLKYFFSFRAGELGLFKKHFVTYYADWIFVLFNFLWIFSAKANFKALFLFFIVSIIVFITLNLYWIKLHRKEKRPVYLFDIKSGKIKPAGIIEFIFFIFEATLIAGFVFSNVSSIFVYIESAVLMFFLLLCIPSSIKIHGRVSTSDMLFVVLGSIVVVGKVLFTIFFL